MAKVYTAPAKYYNDFGYYRVFLGGSIEQGKAENWQLKVIDAFKTNDKILLLNPRRPSWSDLSNLKEQITWELKGQEDSDVCIYYFDPATTSPITLLELGKFSGKALVCCPEGYFRKTNVDVFCERYKIPQVDSLEELIGVLKFKVQNR